MGESEDTWPAEVRHLIPIIIAAGVISFLVLQVIDIQSDMGGHPLDLSLGGAPVIERQEELQVIRKKEEILQRNFNGLSEEEETVERERAAIERALVGVRENIKNAESSDLPELRAHQIALEQRLARLQDVKHDVRQARAMLTALSQDRERYEKFLVESYRQVAKSLVKSRPSTDLTERRVALIWPVAPEEGISAGFGDESYEKRFGFAHNAIDIPTPQGTKISVPADGRVIAVNDLGYGYSTLTILHDKGLETTYGHVSEFFVSEGERVRKGDVIALSGGRPGTRGAGPFTTGPHLHFETRVYGEAVDPEFFLSNAY